MRSPRHELSATGDAEIIPFIVSRRPASARRRTDVILGYAGAVGFSLAVWCVLIWASLAP